MSDVFTISAQKRELSNKKAVRNLRAEERVPGIVYGNCQDPQPISLLHKEIAKSLSNEAFYTHIITLDLEGKSEKVVLKALQRHPFKPFITHVDFMRIDENQPLTMHVPFHFINEEKAPGVKAGGQVHKVLVEAEIRCLPKNIPSFIEIDLINLGVEEAIHLSQIQLPEGVEFVALAHGEDHDLSVVSIAKRRGGSDEVETGAPQSAEVPASKVTKADAPAAAAKGK